MKDREVGPTSSRCGIYTDDVVEDQKLDGSYTLLVVPLLSLIGGVVAV